MSQIRFHSVNKFVEVAGTERAYAALICRNIFLGLMEYENIGKYLKFFREDHPIHKDFVTAIKRNEYELINTIKKYFGSINTNIIVKGIEIPVWHLYLNTALRMGSNPVKLMARIHGSCEIHCFVEGENRNWLAGLIEDGIETNVLRFKTNNMDNGWLNVADMLRDSDDDPVVLSYSVTDPFPNGRNWDSSINSLRKESIISDKELKPETWNTFGFAPKVWIADLWESL